VPGWWDGHLSSVFDLIVDLLLGVSVLGLMVSCVVAWRARVREQDPEKGRQSLFVVYFCAVGAVVFLLRLVDRILGD
jgi:hypothetical protein